MHVSDKGGYRILLSEKVKGMSVAQAFEYIDAIQSFKGDWPLILTPSAAIELERTVELEGITPIPATHGAVAFIEFYVDEEAVASRLSSALKVDPAILLGALERGVPLHRLVPSEALEGLGELEKYVKAFLFETAIPVERKLTGDEESMVASFDWVTDMDTVEVEVPGVSAELVEAELEKAYYVGEYLRRLERLFEKAETVAQRLLLVRGEGEASVRLTELEVMVRQLVKVIPAVEATVMYYRIIPPI